ncbi:hypothetical protein [Atlantibacter sp.]|nr:hypothetical protein [Atlantibacter sp.]
MSRCIDVHFFYGYSVGRLEPIPNIPRSVWEMSSSQEAAQYDT